jgi:hypothetical protein
MLCFDAVFIDDADFLLFCSIFAAAAAAPSIRRQTSFPAEDTEKTKSLKIFLRPTVERGLNFFATVTESLLPERKPSITVLSSIHPDI